MQRESDFTPDGARAMLTRLAAERETGTTYPFAIRLNTSNPRSARVLEKAGFRREGLALHYLQIAGRWEDHHLYAITVEDRKFPDAEV